MADLIPELAYFDEPRLAHFEAYVARLRPVFQRTDQGLRFRAYLRGLLEPGERKNMEAIALAAGRSMMVEADLAQALQHFVSHSPWDGERLFHAVLCESRKRRADAEAVWVIHDTAYPKKGSHSVGVLRQLARDTGRKINCQVAVAITQVGPCGVFPLWTRLYLPASWLRDHADAAAKSIPDDHRLFTTKSAIALALLDMLQESGEPARPVMLGTLTPADDPFLLGMEARGLTLCESLEEPIHRVQRSTAWLKTALGLDHFEGRTWHGWHHHAGLVYAAYDLLAAEKRGLDFPPFPESA